MVSGWPLCHNDYAIGELVCAGRLECGNANAGYDADDLLTKYIPVALTAATPQH